ncbi:hypothetical protein AcV5_009419 [Taiwanofungus camphoratus]|nr:hypothetical protein AcV5_009419 [Antrodia cinnamomea]KAI0924827.1 hypothetical protein AcW2_005594 [Antrodia cinnamomea]
MGAVCCRPQPIDFDGDVNLFHFVLLRCVGKGAFGKVRVVQHKQSRDLYALKYINKAKCVKMKAVANVIQERRLLEEIDHPFVVNLRYAFQDDENCFFVLDLMLGGDLRFHLERLGSLSESAVRFYVAELSSALAYLHDHRIIHRDIKPDNILLDDQGHAHLTDFNIAVHYSERRPLTGVAGSMAYMAPEILTKRGYTYTIDWWSLGVCAYELIFGRRPFRGKTNSDLTHSISKDSLRFPEDAESKCSRDGMQVLRSVSFYWLLFLPPRAPTYHWFPTSMSVVMSQISVYIHNFWSFSSWTGNLPGEWVGRQVKEWRHCGGIHGSTQSIGTRLKTRFKCHHSFLTYVRDAFSVSC